MADLPMPISRRDQQRLTREALVFAARRVFARDGFHGATLAVIARAAGFSKGAVYSNFENKADLFLAVMDLNIRAVVDRAADDPAHGTEAEVTALVENHPEFDEAVRGFALATLEFIATAARDEALAEESAKRVQLLVEGYAALADDTPDDGPADAKLTRQERGALLAALDQGSAMLALAGGTPVSNRALRVGMRRLVGLPDAPADGDETPSFHYRDIRHHIAASIPEEDWIN